VVTPEKEPGDGIIHELVRAGVSHEFTSALVRILTQPAVAEFSATFEWAPGSGPAPATEPTVEIPAAAAERVERVSRSLKTEAASRDVEVLTGPETVTLVSPRGCHIFDGHAERVMVRPGHRGGVRTPLAALR